MIKSKENRRNAVRVAMSTMGGIGYSEFLDLPYEQRELIIEEVNKSNKS